MRRRLRYLDPWLLLAMIGLSVVGVLVIFSTTTGTPREPLFDRHLISLVIGFVVFLIMTSIPFRYLDSLAYVLYGLALISLLLVLFTGTTGYGAQRWLVVGPIRIQPSEAAKVATLLAVAAVLARKRADPRRANTILRVLALVLLPVALILRQPDLGTSMAFVGLLVATLFWAGTPLTWMLYFAAFAVTGLVTFQLPPVGLPGELAIAVGVGPDAFQIAAMLVLWAVFLVVMVGVLAWRGLGRGLIVVTVAVHLLVGLAAPHVWHRLEEYQRIRILTFVDPGRDPTGAGYQVIQSQIAMGSGQFPGRGYLGGTQKALAYLPQQHTDFVFSVVGEEFGFMGSVAVIGLFLLLIARGIRIARMTRDRFASLLAAGAVGILTYHVLVNLFMTMGLAPVTGLPLPFISYGGSFLVVTMALVGILQGIAIRRHVY